MIEGCTCDDCVSACWHNPGWFGTMREVRGAAKLLGLSVVEFAQEYLIQEWWAGSGGCEDISIPAPRRDFTRDEQRFEGKSRDSRAYEIVRDMDAEEAERNGKGFVRASWGHNLIIDYPCIFLDENNRCRIHASKPKECRETYSCRETQFRGRRQLLPYWRKHQDFIHSLCNGRSEDER